MKNSTFYKYQGTGNDFILINNMDNLIQLSEQEIFQACNRNFGIGADGLILVEKRKGYDFFMNYYNSDGKPGSMCGNGGRATIQFFYTEILKKNKYKFLAPDGPHIGYIGKQGNVYLKMKDINQIQKFDSDFIIETGSPHYLRIVKKLDSIHVFNVGQKIRYSAAFKEKGINVNFIEYNPDFIKIATYERGVECETLSCGTGVTAAAILYKSGHVGKQKVLVKAKGGDLEVEFINLGNNQFQDVWLIGPAKFVFKGKYSF